MTEIISKDGTRFTGLAEADTIEIKADKTIVNANSGDDTLTLTKGNGNEIYMDSGNDTIILARTAGKNNIVDAGNDDDVITINGGNKNRIYGGNGNDRITVTDTVGGENKIYGGRGADTFVINAGKQEDSDTYGFNSINGGAGNDKFYLQAGKDFQVSGGNGNDYFKITGGLYNTVNGDAGADKFDILGGTNFIECGDGDDIITIGKKSKGNDIFGGNGNEEIYVNGNKNYISGEAGDDRIEVNGNKNDVNLGAGNDTVNVKGNNNNVYGGSGTDYIGIKGNANSISAVSSVETDSVIEVTGNKNTVRGSGASIKVTGRRNTVSLIAPFHFYAVPNYYKEDAQVKGGVPVHVIDNEKDVKGKASIIGGSGNKVFVEGNRVMAEVEISDSNKNEIRLGEHGCDSVTVNGKSSGNKLYGGSAKDIFNLYNCSGNNNLVRGHAGDDIIMGGFKGDKLYGDNGNDMIFGNDGNDSIHCGKGNDTVDAGRGNDIIYADRGNNSLTGGSGKDIFCFGMTKNAVNIVRDYEAGDVIRFLSDQIFDGYSMHGDTVSLEYMGGTIDLYGAAGKRITYQYEKGKGSFVTKKLSI